MTSIGIPLDQLGLPAGEIKDLDPHLLAEAERRGEFPKEYDFTLYLALLRSWWHVRGALHGVVDSAFEDCGQEVPLWLTLFWGAREHETEESTRTALTGVKYDAEVHSALEDYLGAWAEGTYNEDEMRQMVAAGMPSQERVRRALATNECAPQDILNEFAKDSELHYNLLCNRALQPQMVRDIYAHIQNDEGGPKAMAHAEAELPADIVEALAKRDYPDSYTPSVIGRRSDVTGTALLSLIGKCDSETILNSPSCNDTVRNEIAGVAPSGGALTIEQREYATQVLQMAMSARRKRINFLKGAELQVLAAVRANPKIGLGEVHMILRDAENTAHSAGLARALPTRPIPPAVTPTLNNHPSADDDDF